MQAAGQAYPGDAKLRMNQNASVRKKCDTLLDLCVSSLRRGHEQVGHLLAFCNSFFCIPSPGMVYNIRSPGIEPGTIWSLHNATVRCSTNWAMTGWHHLTGCVKHLFSLSPLDCFRSWLLLWNIIRSLESIANPAITHFFSPAWLCTLTERQTTSARAMLSFILLCCCIFLHLDPARTRAWNCWLSLKYHIRQRQSGLERRRHMQIVKGFQANQERLQDSGDVQRKQSFRHRDLNLGRSGESRVS